MKLSLSVALATSLATIANAQLIATSLASGFDQPTAIVGDPTNSDRIYVIEKTGRVVPVTNGVVGPAVANVSGLIDTAGERGLLGMAFDPNYAVNGRIYLSYVNDDTKALDVVRTVNFNIASAEHIISVPHPTNASNHYGGNIRFGPDGMLFIGMGDGGGANDPENDAQNLDNMLGKIMRIDVSGGGPGYVVPGDNPFVNENGLDEIWAYGLRNPFKFSFDADDLYIADVGQSAWEEVNRMGAGIGGVNYGWQALEGTHLNPNRVAPPDPNAVMPIFEYSHAVGSSITGGVVYRGSELGSHYVGRYFFGDFISRRLWSIDPNAADVAASLEEYTSGLGASIMFTGIEADANGELVLAGYSGGLYRLQAIPEPGTMLALGSAAAILAFRRRRVKATD